MRLALNDLGKGGSKSLAKEIIIAINATAATAKKDAVKKISKHVSVAQKAINSSLKVDRAKPSEGVIHATVTIVSGSRIPLKEFSARQTKAGVSYKMQGKTAKIKSAFIVPGFAGGNVFKRVSGKVRMTKGRYVGKMREPITKLWGPSVVYAAFKNKIKPAVMRDMEPVFAKEIDKRIRKHVRKAMGKY